MRSPIRTRYSDIRRFHRRYFSIIIYLNVVYTDIILGHFLDIEHAVVSPLYRFTVKIPLILHVAFRSSQFNRAQFSIFSRTKLLAIYVESDSCMSEEAHLSHPYAVQD